MIQPSASHATTSGAFAAVRDEILTFAPFKVPLLLEGEPGTGKNTIAGQVHHVSGRPGRFVHEPMPWIPSGMEAATFAGHVRGSFTGAIGDSVGIIAQANRGTLFLDELGEASPYVQGVLLKILESQTVTPVGGKEEVRVDVRIIAATNADLDALVREGRFRRDLLDRFGYFRFRLPTLAQRREEIPGLTQHFLHATAEKHGFDARFAVSPAVTKVLAKAGWPDNIRGLENVCEWAAITAYKEGDHLIELHHLPPRFLDSLGIRLRPLDHKRRKARRMLAEEGGNLAAAARRLGIARPTLYEWLRNGNGETPHPAPTEEAV